MCNCCDYLGNLWVFLGTQREVRQAVLSVPGQRTLTSSYLKRKVWQVKVLSFPVFPCSDHCFIVECVGLWWSHINRPPQHTGTVTFLRHRAHNVEQCWSLEWIVRLMNRDESTDYSIPSDQYAQEFFNPGTPNTQAVDLFRSMAC